MRAVRCPDCGEDVPVPVGARSGTLIDCLNCAGSSLRLRGENDSWIATIAHKVSCPTCEQTITLDELARAGDLIRCCGRTYRLTFEFGAFALEE